MKIKIKTDCSICGVPTLAGQVLEVGVNVSERDAHTLKSFGLAEDQAEAVVAETDFGADLAEAGEAIEPAEEVEEAEAVTEEADPLADALEDQAEAVVAPAQKKKGK